jgi:hypothetical protein
VTFLPGIHATRANRFLLDSSAEFFGESGHENTHVRGASVRRELCAETSTRGTTNDGVNDPVSTAWGHRQGRTAGSFTPSLVSDCEHRLWR